MKLAAAIVIATVASRAHAGGVQVETSTTEVRACLPLPGGDTLVGTGGGLVRVDEKGAARGVWTASDGLPGTRVEAIEAIGGDLWVVTDGGVAKIAAGDDGGVTIGTTIADPGARAIASFGGAIYVASEDRGVLRGKAAIAIKGGARAVRTRMTSLAIAGGALWAGGEAGLYRLDGAKLVRVREGAVSALAGDGDVLWIGGASGVSRRAADGSIESLGGGDVRRLAMVGGALVIAGADGLETIDRGRVVALAGAPRLGVAQAFAADGAGARCAGGLGGLWLDSAVDAPWLHAAADAGPPSNDISALAGDGDTLYVGTFDHGVAIRDGGGWRGLDAPSIDRRVNTILVEPRDRAPARLWIGTAEGLFVVDGATTRKLGKREGLPGRNVLAIVRTSDGRIVAGTSQGAAFVDGARPERVGPRDATHDIGNVWSIAEAPAGTLWLGTTTGLYRGPAVAWSSKDDDGGTGGDWTRLSVASGALADDWVTALVADGGAIYAGTYKAGVARIDVGTDAATQLGGGWINPGGLAIDRDVLTAATMDGLVTFDAKTRAWTAMPGLPGKDTTAIARTGDARWIATRRGLAAVR